MNVINKRKQGRGNSHQNTRSVFMELNAMFFKKINNEK